jgi:hypothetical protein
MKNRMRELRSFGSVRGEGSNVLAYSESRGVFLCFVVLFAIGATRQLFDFAQVEFLLMLPNCGGVRTSAQHSLRGFLGE